MQFSIKSLLCFSFCLMALIACGNDAAVKKTAPASKTIISEHQLPKLLDLGAHQCVPCKMMEPILEELTREYHESFEVEFVDVWLPENLQKAKTHGIRAIPTQIFFDAKGNELFRHEGYYSKEEILKKWKELGFVFQAVTPEAGAEPAPP